MRADAHETLAGEALDDRYFAVERIAAGGFGAIYRARDRDTGRAVAVKVLHPELCREEKHVERFRREAYMVASLRHPNVVAVRDFREVPGRPAFLVMELLDGESLKDRLQVGGALPSPVVEAILRQVLDVLELVHARGIVHRDLKPDNLFLPDVGDGALRVKVLDFGVAKLMECDVYTRLTQTGAIVGTPRYMAPEQLDGRPQPRSDLYSLGAIGWTALTGQPPFPGTDWLQILQSVLAGPPAPLLELCPTVDPRLAAVVEHAMTRDPDGRFEHAAAMRAALDGAPIFARAEQVTLGARPSSVPQEVGSPTRVDRPSAGAPRAWAPTVREPSPPVEHSPAQPTRERPAPATRGDLPKTVRGRQSHPAVQIAARPTAPDDHRPPVAATRERSSGLWLFGAVVLGATLLGGIGGGVWWFMQRPPEIAAAPTPASQVAVVATTPGVAPIEVKPEPGPPTGAPIGIAEPGKPQDLGGDVGGSGGPSEREQRSANRTDRTGRGPARRPTDEPEDPSAGDGPEPGPSGTGGATPEAGGENAPAPSAVPAPRVDVRGSGYFTDDDVRAVLQPLRSAIHRCWEADAEEFDGSIVQDWTLHVDTDGAVTDTSCGGDGIGLTCVEALLVRRRFPSFERSSRLTFYLRAP